MTLIPHQPNPKTNRLVAKLVLIVLGMFGFGFALVPLYDVFCEVTGLNGKTSAEASVVNDQGIDLTREITVQFISRTAKGMPWEFRPEIDEIKVHPGETRLVKFYAKNDSAGSLVGQAVPSVAPSEAASHFKKIECFCFEQQHLQGGEEVWMPVQFYLDRDLPAGVRTLTLSYTLFDITEQGGAKAQPKTKTELKTELKREPQVESSALYAVRLSDRG